MCDPTVIGIASAVAGAVGSGVQYMGQMSAANQQEKEYAAWAQRQSKIRAEENARQEGFRKQAQSSQQQGLQDVSADAQKSAQDQEDARLTNYLQGGEAGGGGPPDVSVADRSLTGMQGGDEGFQTVLAKKINEATGDSRKRIAALAKVSSFGGSERGLDRVTSDALQKSGSGIDAANDLRKGSLGAWDIERRVDPIQVNYNPGPLATLAPALLSFGAQGLGSSLFGAGTGAAAAGAAGAAAKIPLPVPRPFPGHNLPYAGI